MGGPPWLVMEWVLWPWGDVEVMELGSGQDGALVRLGEVGGGRPPGRLTSEWGRGDWWVCP